MSILSDIEIIQLCAGNQMLEPFLMKSVRTVDDSNRKVISYGVSSYGYDARLSRDVKIFTNVNAGIIDPKRLDPGTLIDAVPRRDDNGDEYIILPPNSYMLGCTVETFNMPRDVLAICLGKSTYARAAVVVNCTPIEPGFIGQVVIEISNGSSLPVKIYLNEGVAQFLFFRGGMECATSYGDRNGKYQGQKGIQLPLV